MQMNMEIDEALRLIYIVDADAAQAGDHLDRALGAGVSSLWLRQPGATGAELYRLARDLRARCEAHGTALIVGDRVDVALAVSAHGVQLGHRSPPPRRLRRFFDGWLGVSCHGAADLRHAHDAGADFAVLSPVFGVPAKGPPLGTRKFDALTGETSLPVVALGGIDVANIDSVRSTRAVGVAVIRALRDAQDPAAAATDLAAR